MAPLAQPNLTEVAPGVFAYLQRGSWGYSNAGLIANDCRAILIDTLYDGSLTRRMLDTMRRKVPGARAIETVVNTHANGDHCWGNAELPGAQIISSRATADEMRELPPQRLHRLVSASRWLQRGGLAARALRRTLGRLPSARARAILDAAPFVAQHFGPFAFGPVRLRVPDTTFELITTLELEGRRVELLELGPAHTRGDTVAYVPDARVVFTGDLLFTGSHPIAWEGPVEGWVAACDRLLGLDVDVVVPGHGPLSTKRDLAQTKQYWIELQGHVKRALEAGLDVEAAALEIAPKLGLAWGEESRLVVNVDTIARQLRGDTSKRDPIALLAAMARYEKLRPARAPRAKPRGEAPAASLHR